MVCGWEHLAATPWLPLCVTENIGNLGKLRQPPLLKAWPTHGKTPYGEADFYPELAEVGKRGQMKRAGETSSVL
jgi:hypothetical protein